MANSSLLSVTFCLLVLGHSCLATTQYYQPQQQQKQQSECRIQNLNPLEPRRKFQYEAGVIEEWDENNDQMQCARVAATRHVIEPRGLSLPSFNSAPMIIFVQRG